MGIEEIVAVNGQSVVVVAVGSGVNGPRVVSEGEWVLAENDLENEVVRTPDGDISW